MLLPKTCSAMTSVADELRAMAARLEQVANELARLRSLADVGYVRLFAQAIALTDEEFSRRMLAGICANCTRSLTAYGESPEPGFCPLCFIGRADSDSAEEEDEEEEREQEEEEEEEEGDEEEET